MTRNRSRAARPPDRRQQALADRRTACGRLLWAILTARVAYATRPRMVSKYRPAVGDLWACRAADGYRVWEPVPAHDETDPTPAGRRGRLVENPTRAHLQQLVDAGLVYVTREPAAETMWSDQCPTTALRRVVPTAGAKFAVLGRSAVPAGVPGCPLHAAVQAGSTDAFDPAWLNPRLGWLAAAADRACPLQLFQAVATVSRVRLTVPDRSPPCVLDFRRDVVCLWAGQAWIGSVMSNLNGHAHVPVAAFAADPACLWYVRALVRAV